MCNSKSKTTEKEQRLRRNLALGFSTPTILAWIVLLNFRQQSINEKGYFQVPIVLVLFLFLVTILSVFSVYDWAKWRNQ